MNRLIAATFAMFAAESFVATHTRAAELRVEGALVTLIEQTEVPARDAGVLTALSAAEGSIVVAGSVLAQLDDTEAQLQLDRAEAEAAIAESLAKNDVKVRYALKQSEVANSELRRAEDSIARFERSISQTELDKLKLEAQRCVLAVEEAEHDLHVAKQTLALKQTEVAAARQVVERRRVVAPLDGVVVQTHRRQGEWVKPGDPVLRVMRIDKLRVEAFFAADQLTGDAVGRAVRFSCKHETGETNYSGTLSFVSPEIDPVNGQIRVWAELKNHDGKLRPGQRGLLVVADSVTANAAARQ